MIARATQWLAAPAIAGVLSLLFLKYSTVPYLWMSAVWTIAWFFVAAVSPKALRGLFIGLASLAFSLLAVEGYFYVVLTLPWGLTRDISFTKPYLETDDALGYALVGGSTVHSRLLRGRDVIYDTTYTIDANGLRLTPAPRPPHESDCVLYFGDSFTFGEGVGDRDTSPYVVGELSGYRTYNFSFQGYGPNQILAWIESGRVQQIVTCMPRLIVYETAVEQVPHVAGLASWDPHGPRFVRTPGGVMRAGNFDDRRRSLVRRQLEKAFTYEKFLGRGRPITADDVDLFVDLIAATRKRLADAYPSAQIDVLLWDIQPASRLYQMMRNKVRASGVRMHEVSEILPGYPNQHVRDELSPYDTHPSASAQRAVGAWIVRTLLPPEDPAHKP